MSKDLVVRAIGRFDLDGLLALAQLVGSGMTTLKPERKALAERIEIACASFGQELELWQRDYVFVMEDVARGVIAGVCAIKGSVGLDQPFYNYRIGTLVHSSKELGIFTRMDTLYLSNDLTGCAELCSLFLHPDYRVGTNGKLLSKSRFQFISRFPHLFPEKLIAEMRGTQNAAGAFPFWEHLGKHFFRMEFDRADALTSQGKKSFIAELMPRHPLYVAYLPPEAQAVIGQVHTATIPARRMLEQEGMHYEGYVDIFDGGPVLQARVSELRALRERTTLRAIHAEEEQIEGDPLLVTNGKLEDFRVIVAHGDSRAHSLALTAQQSLLLNCAACDVVHAMPLHPRKPHHD